MTAFISVSGPLSTAIGKCLHAWLKGFLQHVEPWIAAEDIHKGSQWANVISQSLTTTDCGIIVLCPDNLTKPWLMYEAGVIAARTNMERVATLLVDVRPENVEWPLKQFQHTFFAEDDLLRLSHNINAWTGARLSSSEVADFFSVWWPRLEEQVRECKKTCGEMPPLHPRTTEEMLAEILELVRNGYVRGSRLSTEDHIRLLREPTDGTISAGVLNGLLAGPNTAVDSISIQMRPTGPIEFGPTGPTGTRQSSATTFRVTPLPAGEMPARGPSGTY